MEEGILEILRKIREQDMESSFGIGNLMKTVTWNVHKELKEDYYLLRIMIKIVNANKVENLWEHLKMENKWKGNKYGQMAEKYRPKTGKMENQTEMVLIGNLQEINKEVHFHQVNLLQTNQVVKNISINI